MIEGLTEPVAVRFERAGEVFVAEKTGRVKLFAPLPAPGPGVVVLDIQARGPLGSSFARFTRSRLKRVSL